MVPQISQLCPPPLLPQLQSCIHASATDLPYFFLFIFSCGFPQDLMHPLHYSSPKPPLYGEANWNTNLGFAALQISQLYLLAPDLSLAIQTKISGFSLSYSSKHICTVIRQGLSWLKQYCTSPTLSHCFLSLLGTGQPNIWAWIDMG